MTKLVSIESPFSVVHPPVKAWPEWAHRAWVRYWLNKYEG